MNTESFFIEDSEILLAQNLCRLITDDNIRNRAVANALAANIAVKYFEGNSIDVDSATGLHNVSKILDKYDISDIYVKNCYIDVRVCFEDDELSVPVENFEKDLLPVAYMFIKLSADLTEAEVLGFVRPEDVKQENPIEGYYSVPRESLVVYYDIESLLSAYADEPEVEDKAIYSYADGSLQNVDEFLKNLLKSKDARQRFIKIMQAETIFEFVSVNNSVDSESTIDLSKNTDDSLELNDLSLNQEVDLIEPVEDIIAVGEDIDLLSEAPINESLELNDDSSDSTLYLDNNNLENDVLSADVAEENQVVNNTEEFNYTNSDDIQDFNSDDIQLMSSYDSAENLSMSEDPIVLQEDNNNEIELNNNENDNTKEDEVNNSIVLENNYYNELENELVDKNASANSTNSTNSIESYEDINDSEMSRLLADDNDSILSEDGKNNTENNFSNGFTTVMSSNADENIPNDDNEAHNNQLDTLFDKDDEQQHSNSGEEVLQSSDEPEYDNGDIDFYVNDKKTKKSGMKPLLILIFTALVASAVYFGFTKFNSSAKIDNEIMSEETRNSIPETTENETPEAMPNETVEPVQVQNEVNEPTSTAIPAIEQNLDASILVSNLKVFWEVPAAYSSNTSANRYLVKLGKVVQLNLKSELLLLNKPPISNKIAIEISYNPNSRKFVANGITISSGEKSVDDVILNTVNRALAMNMSMNTDSFAKLQGNPVLIIQF